MNISWHHLYFESDPGRTPLHEAVARDSVEDARMLLGSGADVNAVETETGWTPIFYAKTAEMVRLLRSAGADIGRRDASGRTPLHKAAADGAADALSALIESGADIDARDEENWTPLHWAANWYGNDATIGILLFYGADVSVVNRTGETACALAGWRHYRPIVPPLPCRREAIWAQGVLSG